MTKNDLFTWSLTVITVMSAFVGHFLPDAGVFNVGGLLTWPTGIDFIFETLDAFIGLLTFSITDMPIFISLFAWALTIVCGWVIGTWIFG